MRIVILTELMIIAGLTKLALSVFQCNKEGGSAALWVLLDTLRIDTISRSSLSYYQYHQVIQS